MSWGYGPPMAWNQSGLGAATPQMYYNPTALYNPPRFPLFFHQMPPPVFAQFPVQLPNSSIIPLNGERAPQLSISSYPPAAYPQSSGSFSTQAHGMLAICQAVTPPPELHTAAWAADKFGPMKNYRCGYCGRTKESISGVRNKRTRIRCECGGPQQDGQTRIHSK